MAFRFYFAKDSTNMVLDTRGLSGYLWMARSPIMSTTLVETPRTSGASTPLAQTPARTTTLILIAFAAIYIVWGSTYLAIRVGIESFPPLLLAGFRHLVAGLVLYPVFRWKTGITYWLGE